MSVHVYDSPGIKNSDCYVLRLEWVQKQIQKKLENNLKRYSVDSPSAKSCLQLIPKFSKKPEGHPDKTKEICLRCYENDKKNVHHFKESVKRSREFETVGQKMCRMLKKRMNICEMYLQFEKEHKPWYIPNIPTKKILAHDRLYNSPCLILRIDPGFTDYQKTMLYIENGIRLFHINLKDGNRNSQIKTLTFFNQVKSSLPPELFIAVIAQIGACNVATGALANNATSVYLDRDSKILLSANRKFYNIGSHEIIYVNMDYYLKYLYVSSILGIGTEIKLEIVTIHNKTITCIVKKPGLLVPNMEIMMPPNLTWMHMNVSKLEEEDIQFAVKNQCNLLLCPRADKIKVCQYAKWVATLQGKSISLLGKIYPHHCTSKMIKNIITEYHGIWIKDDKEVMSEEHEKLVYEQSKLENTPIIREGHFITSEHIKLPCLALRKYYLLFPHTLVFHYKGDVNPLEVRRIIKDNYPDMNGDLVELCCKYRIRRLTMSSLLGRYIALDTLFRKVNCVICLGNTGRMAFILANNSIVVPIIAVVGNYPTARKLLLWRNVFPLMYRPKNLPWNYELNERLRICIKYCTDRGILDEGSSLVVAYPSSHDCLYSDSFRVLTLNQDTCRL